MPSTPTSFLYSPVRQGYDLSSWKTIQGAPAIASSRLNVKAGGNGETAHYADILKGDISFSIQPPTQGIGSICTVGLTSVIAGSSAIKFTFTSTLQCITSFEGNTTASATIPWDAAWEATPTTFRIRWEAGSVKFYVNGTKVYQVSDSSVPSGPLCIHLVDLSTVGNMTVGEISVRGSQSINLNPKVS
jgi:hypothetical protein